MDSRVDSRLDARSITVSGSGTALASPDAVSVVLGVEVVGDTPAAALRACGAAQADLLAALGVTSTASGLSVAPGWDQERNRPGRPVASSVVTATLPDLSAAGEQVTAALEAGGKAARLQSLSPVVSDPTAARAQARELAFADALATAEQYAALAGGTLGELLQLAEGASLPGGDLPVRMMAVARDSYAVADGATSLSVSVVATWALAST